MAHTCWQRVAAARFTHMFGNRALWTPRGATRRAFGANLFHSLSFSRSLNLPMSARTVLDA